MLDFAEAINQALLLADEWVCPWIFFELKELTTVSKMVRNYMRKTERQSWTEENMKRVIEAVKSHICYLKASLPHPLNNDISRRGKDRHSAFLKPNQVISLRAPEATSAARAGDFNRVGVCSTNHIPRLMSVWNAYNVLIWSAIFILSYDTALH